MLDTAVQVIDSLWLTCRAGWPISASADWAVERLREHDWSVGTQASVP